MKYKKLVKALFNPTMMRECTISTLSNNVTDLRDYIDSIEEFDVDEAEAEDLEDAYELLNAYHLVLNDITGKIYNGPEQGNKSRVN